MGLRTRVIEIFYQTATSKVKIKNLLTPVGVIFFFAIVILFIVSALLLDRLLGLPALFPPSLNIILATPVLFIGLTLMLWSIFHFIKIKGTPVPFNPPPKLVTTGPYAFVRNPMLTGVFILLFGFGFLFGSISLVFIFTPLFILANILELKAIEEPELKKRLGNEYLEYIEKTPMFIPGLNTRKKH